jgi:tRNA (Thr-GGU) A37 N-methylase
MNALVVREIASFVEETDEILVLKVMPALNPDILDGLSEWSHCWIVFLSSGEVDMELFAIYSIHERLVSLRKLAYLGKRCLDLIVDIKPCHPLDLASHSYSS